MKFIGIVAVLVLWFSSNASASRLDTSFTFSTIETPHFSLHFHQGLESVARKAALIAEEVHESLRTEFAWQPSEKTELVLIDNSDFSNGYATVLPYNIIFIQTVPPGIMSTLGEYDDWLKIVITHEYAHIITSDSSRGYWKAVRAVFGKPIPGIDPLSWLFFLVTAPPNNFLPRWWHEGMATWAETEYSGAGRGRSSYYDMVFRMAVAENNVPTVAQINGDVPDWPTGNLPYLYGYKLQQYIADTYGKETLGKLNSAHAGRFPYAINAPPQDLFNGKRYRDLYDDMISALTREESGRITTLSSVPFTSIQTLSRQGEMLSNPRFSPDGSRIAITRRDPHDHTSTVITGRDGTTIQAEFKRQYSDGSVCWSPDGSALYFTQAEINNGYNTYQDIYVYNQINATVSRLTRGQRLGDIDISPDGRRFVAVASDRGSQNLVLLDVNVVKREQSPRQISSLTMQRVASPRWSPDGTKISYTATDNSGKSTIHLFDVAAGSDLVLFEVKHTAAFPVWSKDGSYLLYVSDETGVFNLFAYDLKERSSRQVSHLLGGAVQPDISPDGKTVIFSSYNSRGFSIAEMTLDREKWQTLRSPSIVESHGVASPVAVSNGLARETTGGTVPETVTPYSSLRTVLPHFWLPRISGDGSGKAVFGLFTAGADVLGYNSYALTADFSPGRSRGYYNLEYQNDYFYPTFFLNAHAAPFIYANLQQNGDYFELNQGITLGTSIPINSLESRYRLTAGYQFEDQKALSPLDSAGRFNSISVFQGRRDSLFAGVNYDNVQRYPYSISSEDGRRISLLYRRYGRELGNEQQRSEYSGTYQEFLHLPTDKLKNHILYLRFAAALADTSQQSAQQSFQLGGTPSALNHYSLRGYPERSVTGRYIATTTLEYRAPLFSPMYGPGTVPAFAEKVHGAVFVDAGEVWDDQTRFQSRNVKVGAGIELRMDMTLGYWLKVTPALGVARGFSHGGENQVYLTVYVDL
jgi:Tol biopolymer transport system component